MTRSVRWFTLVAACLFVFTFLYRFNTLGGALGGFDDDHFVHFAFAKQVQSGEQPLRDFAGMGLQGARPSLSFELSAAAQSLFGNNLRSEALLCVTAIALAAVLTLAATSLFAPLWIALGATVLSVFLAPKLYNYPKVLVLATVSCALVAYSRKPSSRGVVGLALVSVASFLFRHDLAVYAGLATLVVVIAAETGVVRGLTHLVLYGFVVLALLAPSLYLIQRDAGIVEYVRHSADQARHESRRTQAPWPQFTTRGEDGALSALSFFGFEQNAIAWLYYLHVALPLVGLLAWARASVVPLEYRAALVAIVVASMAAMAGFLRGNMGARFGDMAPWFALLFAAAAAWAVKQRDHESFVRHGGRVAAALVITFATVQSVWAVGSVTQELDTAGWSDSAKKVVGQVGVRWKDLGVLPRLYWGGDPPTASIATIQYLHRCTTANERVAMIGYEPEILPLADRRFTAGRPLIVPEAGLGPGQEEQMREWFRPESAPLVFAEADPEWPRELPLIARLLSEQYVESGTVEIDGGVTLQVFARRSPGPVGTFRGLPCFH